MFCADNKVRFWPAFLVSLSHMDIGRGICSVYLKRKPS